MCVHVIISLNIFIAWMILYFQAAVCMKEKKSTMGGIFTFGREDAISSMGLAEASSGDKLKVSRSSL